MEKYKIEDFTFAYPDISGGKTEPYGEDVLSHINLKIEAGDFVLLMGPSGCGKTTLLRHLKSVMAPVGKSKGKIYLEGRELSQYNQRYQTEKIGFVMQDVDAQLVTDKVWHELAFGLESLGRDQGFIRRKVAEMCSFFGITEIFRKNVSQLSGGQKQLVNLASVMAMDPDVLLLDEPTSQLDPIAAMDFLDCLRKINKELGTTIIMTEHRTSYCLTMANKVVALKHGKIWSDSTLVEAVNRYNAMDFSDGFLLSMPVPVQIFLGLKEKDKGENLKVIQEEQTGSKNREIPETASEGKVWLADFDKSHSHIQVEAEHLEKEHLEKDQQSPIITLKDLCFSYEKEAGQDQTFEDVIRQLNLTVNKGETLAINGGNGCGKTTTLLLLAGLLKPCRGKIKIKDGAKVSMVPQDPKTLFCHNLVLKELQQITKDREELRSMAQFFELDSLLDRNPYDLSGGEQQKLAFAKVLLGHPDILLLDEPTKGMDAGYKQKLGKLFAQLKNAGLTIVMVSHDIEFCAENTDRSALFFDGQVAWVENTVKYFSGNSFYTTVAAQMSSGILEDAVTVKQVLKAYGVKVSDSEDKEQIFHNPLENQNHTEENKNETFSECKKTQLDDGNNYRKKYFIKFLKTLLMVLSGVFFLYGYVKTMLQNDLTKLIKGEGVTTAGRSYITLYILMAAALLVFLLCVAPAPQKNKASKNQGGKLRGAKIMSLFIVFILIPLTIWFGGKVLYNKKYYFISLLILIEAMVPFFLIFTHRKPKTRELVTLAVMCALGITGRTAFFMLPNFTPVIGIVMISGVAFGGEAGFVTGAITMLGSNVIFGQGPWTPWQMFAMGLLGYFAGALFGFSGGEISEDGTRRVGLMRQNFVVGKLNLCIFGAISAIIIYGGIMNLATVLLWQSQVKWSMIVAAYVAGFPFDLISATATVIFLWFFAKPFLEKLDRIRIKYGLNN